MGLPDDSDTPSIALDLSDLAPGESPPQGEWMSDETFLDAYDGKKLFCRRWAPAEGTPERGAIALMHGYGEHVSRYEHVAVGLVRAGYGVMAIDARGHGRSTGDRAHIDAYGAYVRDFGVLVRRVNRRWPNVPTLGLGHSNGGLVALHYALEDPPGIEGFAVTSPMCDFALDIPSLKRWSGKWLSRIWPSFSFESNLNPDELTHVSRVVEQYRDDPLVQRRTTARWFTEALEAQSELRRRASELEQPFLFIIPGCDRICSSEAAEAIFHRMSSPDREMKVIPEAYHEVLNERNWDDVLRHIVDWMAPYT